MNDCLLAYFSLSLSLLFSYQLYFPISHSPPFPPSYAQRWAVMVFLVEIMMGKNPLPGPFPAASEGVTMKKGRKLPGQRRRDTSEDRATAELHR